MGYGVIVWYTPREYSSMLCSIEFYVYEIVDSLDRVMEVVDKVRKRNDVAHICSVMVFDIDRKRDDFCAEIDAEKEPLCKEYVEEVKRWIDFGRNL